MKLNALLLAGLATLATSCGQDAASKKLADEAEARVVASIKQVLVQSPTQGGALDPVHTWYQSNEVPNIIKLDPNAEAVYRDHAAILQEVATNQTKLATDPILTPAQGQGVRTMYQKLVDESATNVQQLTLMAMTKTTMSEAEQRQFVAGVADKEKKELGLVRYFTKRTAFGIDQETRKKNQKKINREVWGM
ncbi:MAG: hypothetical protein ACRYG7_07590 [Janthinobacterium lividum]